MKKLPYLLMGCAFTMLTSCMHAEHESSNEEMRQAAIEDKKMVDAISRIQREYKPEDTVAMRKPKLVP